MRLSSVWLAYVPKFVAGVNTGVFVAVLYEKLYFPARTLVERKFAWLNVGVTTETRG